MGGLLSFIEDLGENFIEGVSDIFDDAVDFVQDGIQGILGLDIDQPDLQKGSEGALVTKIGATQSIPLVYGRRRVGGVLIFMEETGTDNEDLWLVYVLADGDIPINKISDDLTDGEIMLNDIPLSDPRYTGLHFRQITLGGHSTQPFSFLETASDSKWTSNHILHGVAAIGLRLTWNGVAFSGLPRASFPIVGTELLDLDVLPTETRRRSTNPAEVLFDYLTNDIVGKGLSKVDGVDINLQSFKDARDYCNDSITSYSGGPNHIRFSCDIVLNTDSGVEIMDNVQAILQTCRGSLPFINGIYHLIIEKHYTIADYGLTTYFNFNIDNIIGGWSFKSGDVNSRYNRVKVTFPNEDKNFKSDYVVVESSTFRTEDGRVLEKTISLTGITNIYRALDFASVVLRRSRNQLISSFISNQEGRLVTVGSIVTVTHPTPGWTDQEFRVTRMQLLKSGNCGITIAMHDSTVYDLSIPNEAISTSLTNLPDPSVVPAITGLTLLSNETVLTIAADGTLIPRIKVTWDIPSNIFVENYDVTFKKSADSAWLPAGSPSSATDVELFIPNVEEGIDYDVRVRAKNSGDFTGAWTTELNHTVIGKTSKPGDVSQFLVFQQGNLEIFKWNQVSDKDLSGYDIKYGPNATATWETAITLTNVTKGTNVTSADVPPGDWKFFVKAVDTSGNESVNAATYSLLIENQSTVISATEESPLWPGTLVGLLRHYTGVLVVDSTDDADENNFNIFDNYNNFPVAISTYESLESDIGFNDTIRLWSSLASSPGPGEIDALLPSIEIDTRVDAGSYDGYGPWTIGQILLRYFKVKVIMDNTQGVSFLSGTQLTTDDLLNTKSGTLTVAALGTAVIFDTPFHNVPIVTPNVIGGTALIPAAANITATGFTFHLFNTSGTDVGGDGSWEATGV